MTTTDDTLAWLVRQLATFPGRPAPRLEISIWEDQVYAQLIADEIPVPLVGTAKDAPEALHHLKVAIEHAISDAKRRRISRRPRR